MNAKNDTKVYHYCSMTNFYNIINSKEIWINDVLKMNDFREMKILIDGFLSIICEEFRKSPFELIIKSKKVSQEFVLNLIHEMFRCRLDDFNYHNKLKYRRFIACFSEECDVLSQWEMYANHASGIAIPFNINDISELTKRNKKIKSQIAIIS